MVHIACGKEYEHVLQSFQIFLFLEDMFLLSKCVSEAILVCYYLAEFSEDFLALFTCK